MAIPVSHFLKDQRIIQHPENPQTPLVSVIMPTYRLRPGGYTQRAIESVLAQSFTDFEFIIIDDGSIDGLWEVLLEYQRQDPRIVLIRHKINGGLPAIRVNEGISLAKGRLLAFMFEDDEWLPDALAQLGDTALQGSGECVVYGAVEWIIHHPDGSVEHTVLGEWNFNYGLLKNSNRIANCAILIPKTAMSVSGLYDPHILLRRCCDYDLWLRLAQLVPFRRCPHVIGRVTAGTRYAIGSTVDQDLVLTQRYLSTDRNALLMPSTIADYEVDSLWFVLDPREAHRIREHYIIPFWEQHAALLTPSEQKQIIINPPYSNRLLVTKSDFSTSVDVTLGNFSKILGSNGPSFAYLQERSLAAISRWNYDTLVLYRTIGAPSLQALQKARAQGKAVVYLIDDNMFKFGTGYLAEEFAYLKPGSPGYRALEEEVAASDLVISYSPPITNDCRERNPRVVELHTNIREKYILASEPPTGGHSSGRRLKYGILTGSARKKELQTLWDEFQTFASHHPDKVEFHIWGVDLEGFDSLPCPTRHRPFNHSYENYLQALADEKFDFVLCPLFNDHETKISKSPIKYLEATVAGAVGIYSDVVVYQTVEHGVTGLKASNNPGGWLETLEASLQLTDEQRRSLHAAAREHILAYFTTEAQVLEHVSAFQAAELHAGLASHSSQGGQAAIAYFFHESLLGGATLHLFQHASILKRYGFQPILCFQKQWAIDADIRTLADQYSCEVEQLDFVSSIWWREPTTQDKARAEALAVWMRERNVRFIHMVTYNADVALAARRLGLPCLATLHAHYDEPARLSGGRPFEIPLVSAVHSSSLRYARKWQQVLDAPAFYIRAPISDAYFAEYKWRHDRQIPGVPILLVSGTLQPRKGQLEAIHAVAELAKQGIEIKLVLLGYDHLRPEYVAECRQAIRELGLEAQATIAGFAREPRSYYEAADYVLCASDDEFMPQSILRAMASGIRVITTPVGGVEELVVDGFSGVVAHGYEVADLADAIQRALEMPAAQWKRMLENAHDAARMACSEEVVTYKLLSLYNLAARETTNTMRPARPTWSQVEPTAILPLSVQQGPRALALNDPVSDRTIPRRLTSRGLTYRVICPDDDWCGLRITFGSRNSTMRERIVMTIRLGHQPHSALRTLSINLTETVNDRPQDIVFPAIHNSRQAEFLIELKPEFTESRQELFICEGAAQTGLLERLARKITTDGGYLHGHLLFNNSSYPVP